MCGRFTRKASWAEIREYYNLLNSVNVPERYNVAPSQDVVVVLLEDGKRRGENFRWGLIPSWAKDAKVGYSMINAKAETVADKPAFRSAFKSRRCIIPADGFYEWQKIDAKRKQPYFIGMKDGGLFGFAGLWERWTDKASGETIRTCTIITTEPNALCAPIHNRMPVILDPKDYPTWLGEQPASNDALKALLRPYPAARMRCWKIGPRVGNVKNDDPALIEPVAS